MRIFITLLALLMIGFGIYVFSYRYLHYTTQEKIVQIGNLEVTASNEKTIYFPPVLGGAMIVGGIGILILSRRK